MSTDDEIDDARASRARRPREAARSPGARRAARRAMRASLLRAAAEDRREPRARWPFVAGGLRRRCDRRRGDRAGRVARARHPVAAVRSSARRSRRRPPPTSSARSRTVAYGTDEIVRLHAGSDQPRGRRAAERRSRARRRAATARSRATGIVRGRGRRRCDARGLGEARLARISVDRAAGGVPRDRPGVEGAGDHGGCRPDHRRRRLADRSTSTPGGPTTRGSSHRRTSLADRPDGDSTPAVTHNADRDRQIAATSTRALGRRRRRAPRSTTDADADRGPNRQVPELAHDGRCLARRSAAERDQRSIAKSDKQTGHRARAALLDRLAAAARRQVRRCRARASPRPPMPAATIRSPATRATSKRSR